MSIRDLWGLLKGAGGEFIEDNCPRLGAALSFYAVFALAPLLVIVLAVIGFVFDEEIARGEIVSQLRYLVGEQGGQAIETMLQNARREGTGGIAAIIGVVVFLVAATGLFVELQDSLNVVWNVQPKKSGGLLKMLRDRLLSFGMMLGVAFLLLVSLIVSTVLSAIGGFLGAWLFAAVAEAFHALLSLGVITAIFALIFRFLPDARISWSDVWLGAFITACLFIVGKFLIGIYLGQSTIGSTYGAAGSLAVLLIWLYYSAQIFLFGAEFTQQYSKQYGKRILPVEYAEPRDPDRPGKETVGSGPAS